jgi:hypothetical protein
MDHSMPKMKLVLRAFFVWGFIYLLFCPNSAMSSEICITKKCPSGTAVELTFVTKELVAMLPVEVNLKLTDGLGKPLSHARISCSLFLPNYDAGVNSPKLKQSEQDGLYKGIVIFTQAGEWNAHLIINYSGGKYEEVTLEIKNVLSKRS